MDEEIKKACIRAGVKLGGGLLLLCAVIGIRVVTADPDGIKAEIAELEAVDEELAVEAAERPASDAAPSADDSLLSRVGQGVRERLPSSVPADPSADRLVSCRLGGGVQFMRAADCLARGGESKDLAPKR